MRRRFYAIPAPALKAFTALTGSRESLTQVPTRRSTGNVGAQVSQRDVSQSRVGARDSTVTPRVRKNSEVGSLATRKLAAEPRLRMESLLGDARRPTTPKLEAQRLVLHPQEAKVPSRGLYVPRDLFPQSFH
jgi:hypothetical protein